MLEGLFIAGIARESIAAAEVGHSAHRAADRAHSKASSVEFDVEKLFLVTHALWSILKEKHGYSDDDLIKRVTEIDLLDGKLDGKLSRTESRPNCAKCGRKIMGQRDCCMYCGQRTTTSPFRR